MTTAAKAAVAVHFDVTAATVKVTVTKSRRLSTAPNSTDTWAVGYEFMAPAANVAAVEAKVAELQSTTGKNALKSVVGSQLIAAGAPQSAVDSMIMTAASATKVQAAGPTEKPLAVGGAYSPAGPLVIIASAVARLLAA